MAKRFTVTAECHHPVDGHPEKYDDWHELATGTSITANSDYVIVDGEIVLRRDRRMKKNRIPGHPWLDEDGLYYTTFDIRVED